MKNNKKEGRILYTGDLHFGHENAIKYDQRPWANVDTMARGLIECWNSAVADNDTVYVLGDVCYRCEKPAWHYLEQMKGHKILIIGNHDGDLLKDERSRRCFEDIRYYMEICDGDKRVVLCHYPLAEWNGMSHGNLHVFAHIHCQRNTTYEIMHKLPNAVNAGCMINGYVPVTLDKLVENNRRFNAVNREEETK